jgi:hypothetical protein
VGVTKSEAVEGVKSYLTDHGFGNLSIAMGWRKGTISIGSGFNGTPLQKIGLHLKKRLFGSKWRAELDGDYLENKLIDIFEFHTPEQGRRVAYKPAVNLGWFGEKSPNLRKLYKVMPSMKGLRKAEFLAGMNRGIMETAANAQLFVYLGNIDLLSNMLDGAMTIPGAWKGERKGKEIIESKIMPITPAARVAKHLEGLRFLTQKSWHARICLEEYLRKAYFKEPKEFEGRYLAKCAPMNEILRDAKSLEEKVNEVAKLIFGSRVPDLAKDRELYNYLANQSMIPAETVEDQLGDFYGQISAIPSNIPTSQKLWTRKTYSDLVDNFVRVVKRGFYDEIDPDSYILAHINRVLKHVTEGKRKLKRDDLPDVEAVARDYHAFLISERDHIPNLPCSEQLKAILDKNNAGYSDCLKSITEGIDKKIQSVKRLISDLSKRNQAIPPEMLKELYSYVKSTREAEKDTGAAERRVYCPLADARRKFIDEPVSAYIRDLNPEEVKNLKDMCFESMNSAKVGELGCITGLAGMIIASAVAEKIPFVNSLLENRLLKALVWGIPIGVKAFYESNFHAVVDRVLEFYLLVECRSALVQNGINPEATFAELRSALTQIYLEGYMIGTSTGLSFLYATDETNMYPIRVPGIDIDLPLMSIPMVKSAGTTAASYMSYLRFMNQARSGNIIPAQPPKVGQPEKKQDRPDKPQEQPPVKPTG